MRLVASYCVTAALFLVSAAESVMAQPGGGKKGGGTQLDARGAAFQIRASDPGAASEEVLRAAGLNTDGEALLEYFRERSRPKIDLEETLALARQLGEPDAGKRTKAVGKILACGPWAIPALNHVIQSLDDSGAAQRARECRDWLEGDRATEVPIAAARLLAIKKPEAAAEVLLAFLPLADDQAVVVGIKAALSGITARPGKADAALLAALRDPLALRRAIAVEVLAGSGRPEALLETRKLLSDPKSQVRLRTAVALTQQLEEPAIEVLIDLLAQLPAHERRPAEMALRQLAGEWSPSPPSAGDDALSRKIRRDVWSAWWRAVDGPALLAAFRQRTLTREDAAAAQSLIEQLGDKSFDKRERASAELIAQGFKVAGLLRAIKSPDSEHSRRVETCLKEIAQKEEHERLPLSAPNLLAARKPAGAADALLGFLPFTDDRAMAAEVVKSLIHLQRSQATADGAIIRALSDPLAVRRIAAAEILVGAGGASHPAVRELLTDADPQVRLPVGMALVHAQQREGVPVLIELIAELPSAQARDADDVLRRLAGAKAPARPSADDAAARKNLRAAWQSWWKENGAAVNLAVLEKAPAVSGLMVVAELGPARAKMFPAKKGIGGAGGGLNPPADPPGGDGAGELQAKKGGGKQGIPAPMPANPLLAGSDRLVGIDRAGKPHWQMEGLEYPIDFQMLTGDRALIAEYAAKRVTERDLTGKILWEATDLPGAPINVQRLANGNTFVVAYNSTTKTGCFLVELDRAGKTVATTSSTAIESRVAYIRAACKMPNGALICSMSTGACVTLDATGKQIKRFPLTVLAGVAYFGNLDVTPKGHIVVMQKNAVVEFDPEGKLVWQAQTTGNRATRLANGNTLVASDTGGVVELDHAGKTVWHYQPPPGYQAIRAR